MSKGLRSDNALCVNFCAYYRPGKNEDLMCQGFRVVHGLVRNGRRIGLTRPQRILVAGPDAIEALKKRVCAVCSFRAADCDFIATNGAAAPCGGFTLLSHLIGAGDLTPEEVGGSPG